MRKPRKWPEVYAQGTTEGNEEQRFFKALARGNWEWVSVAQIVQETGLPRKRIEEIINKYQNFDPPLVFASETKEDHYAYWERVPDLIKDNASLTEVDQNKRIQDQQITDRITP